MLKFHTKLKRNNALSKEELEAILDWMISEEKKPFMEQKVLHEWDSFETSETYDYEDLLYKLNRKIDDCRQEKKFPVRKYIRYVLETAAIVIIAVGISFFVTDSMKKRYQRQVEARNPEKIEIYNPKGLRTTITLPDNSKVILNADSKIAYLKDFLPDNRTVYLEGEAFFDVAKDTTRPFVVQTDGAKMTALGTSFNVCSYPENKYITTTLIEGSVYVETFENTHILIPGSQSYIDKVSQEARIQEIDAENVIGWIEGKLYFQLTPFNEIATILERKFSVNIQVKNSGLLQKRFTGKFENGEGLEQIMKILASSALYSSTYNEATNTIEIR